MRYYRKKTMDALRNENKRLKERINLILDSQEGKEYKRRKAREYYREYREKNKDKLLSDLRKQISSIENCNLKDNSKKLIYP